MGRKKRRLIALSALVLAISACTADTASKAGGDQPPLVLTMGTNDYRGRPAAEQIEYFAERVDALSEGQIRIESQWDVGGRNTPDWDQVVARQVVDGELDLGNIPARAWDAEGVTSFRALNAPFLITTDGLLDEVVSSDLADEMLAGLDGTGVVGLGMVPEGLRHPFGFASPLLGPEDYEGAVIRTPTSLTVRALFEALGAIVTDDNVDTSAQAGMESAYYFDPQGPATGNVVFFPKVNTMVINTAVFDRLTDGQRDVLDRAAAETLAWAIETRPSDAEQAKTFCERGGAVVVADAESLAALVTATEPVYATLESDPQTRDLIAAIREMGQGVQTSAATPAACGSTEPAGGGTEASGPGNPAEIGALNGVYRLDLSEERLRAGGVPEEQIQGNAGIWTITLENGVYSDQDGFQGTYIVDGDQFTMTFKIGSEVTYGWQHNAKGDLILEVVETQPEWIAFDAVWTDEPWARIGDVASDEFPQGSYRVEHPIESLMEQGLSEAEAYNYRGVWTLSFDDGKLTIEDATGICNGSYSIAGGRFSLLLGFDDSCGTNPGTVLFTAGWEVDDQGLRFVDLAAGSGDAFEQALLETLFASSPLVKVD